MPIIPYKGNSPTIAKSVFVAPDAWVTGKVTIGEDATILFGVVIRGDIQEISIGAKSNLQEHAVAHTSRGKNPCKIGSEVTVGHHAILHGCTVNDRCIIGMNSVILDDAEIGSECIIGAHSLVTMNTKIPPRSLAVGSPAKVVRPLTEKELQELRDSAEAYYNVGKEYARVIQGT